MRPGEGVPGGRGGRGLLLLHLDVKMVPYTHSFLIFLSQNRRVEASYFSDTWQLYVKFEMVQPAIADTVFNNFS
jgi:hypothetical protein